MYAADKEYIKTKYNLEKLRDLENIVAEAVNVSIPFNNYITGYCAFTHKVPPPTVLILMKGWYPC
jgi:homocitrate synthase